MKQILFFVFLITSFHAFAGDAKKSAKGKRDPASLASAGWVPIVSTNGTMGYTKSFYVKAVRGDTQTATPNAAVIYAALVKSCEAQCEKDGVMFKDVYPTGSGDASSGAVQADGACVGFGGN
jgi:hypothetical protein